MCETVDYGNLDADTGIFYATNSYITSPWLPRMSSGEGTVATAGLPSGQIEVSFYGRVVTEPNYHVMETDYTTYSVVYGCQEDVTQNLWILSRTPTMDADLL